MFRISLLIILLHYTVCSIGQRKTENPLFKVYREKGMPENRFGEILISKGGQMYISASEFMYEKIFFGNYGTFTIVLDKSKYENGIANNTKIISSFNEYE